MIMLLWLDLFSIFISWERKGEKKSLWEKYGKWKQIETKKWLFPFPSYCVMIENTKKQINIIIW